MKHIFWTCPCTQACWKKIICQSTSELRDLGYRQGFNDVVQAGSRQRVPRVLSILLRASILTKIMHMQRSRRGCIEPWAASVLIFCHYSAMKLRSRGRGAGGNNQRRRRRILAVRYAATPSGRKARVLEGQHQTSRSSSAIISPNRIQSNKRVAGSCD